jgi:transposase
MLVRDRPDELFEDEEFTDLYPSDGCPGFSPGQLAPVSVLQFAENLSDRAAADAVRTRIDFTYALGLELEESGFDYSVLSEFRARLAEGDANDRLLRVVLKRLAEAGLLKSGGRQRSDATHVPAAVRTLSRLELAGKTLRAALEELAVAGGDWLRALIESEWDKFHGRKVEIGKESPAGRLGSPPRRRPSSGTAGWSWRLPGARLVPAEHVVDAACITPARIERARRVHGITLLGPSGARSQPPGQERWRIRQVRLHRGLGQQAGHLPPRADQPELGPLRIDGHDYSQVRFAVSSEEGSSGSWRRRC